MENLIVNGDFSQPINEANFVNSQYLSNVKSITDGKLVITHANGTKIAGVALKARETIKAKDKVYVTAKFSTYLNILANIRVEGAFYEPLESQTGVSSKIITNEKETSLIEVFSRTVLDGQSFAVDDVVVINLTKSFGAGKEPSKEEMDRLMDYLGYFNGSKTISIGRFI